MAESNGSNHSKTVVTVKSPKETKNSSKHLTKAVAMLLVLSVVKNNKVDVAKGEISSKAIETSIETSVGGGDNTQWCTKG